MQKHVSEDTCYLYLVRMAGFEPARPLEHYPLKVKSLMIYYQEPCYIYG